MDMKLHLYTVEGKGTFPLDMLRYDCAWPSHDASTIVMTAQRSVSLASYQEPTTDRWRSFGWTVKERMTA